MTCLPAAAAANVIGQMQVVGRPDEYQIKLRQREHLAVIRETARNAELLGECFDMGSRRRGDRDDLRGSA